MFDTMHGALATVLPTVLLTLGTIAVPLALGFFGAPLWAWAIGITAWTVLAGWPIWLTALIVTPIALLCVPAIRQKAVTGPVFRLMQKLGMLPVISETERTALESGTVWIDGELFSGKPNFKKLLNEPYPDLTERERAFLDGPCKKLCEQVDDWQVWQERDLPPDIWQYLKDEKFFGMIIPEQYGGLGFSATANSAVVQLLGSRSLALGVTVMVPNSLGPAELLIHYGTEDQRKHWLPRLANGTDIPCFALTEPGAGSDAGAISSSGEVFRGDDGKLYVKLQWRKRYITLAAISTVLGLAFKLRDPHELLGQGKDLGITCALIPTDTDGVQLGERHDPLGVPFYNCPTEGHDVVVPVDAIIGGPQGAGQGWRMLTECLAAGRGISLPAVTTGGVKATARVASAHAAVRKQFGLPIGKFEGIEEPLARITGFAYIMEAARRYTCGGLDEGAKPAVITAMAKYNFTELMRQAINDGMDILGGNAISRGPRNTLAHAYIGMPISITVEGANILTRTLIVFGQGAIRCHPYAYHEMEALRQNDEVGFDRAFAGHIGHVVRNATRCTVLGLTRGWLAKATTRGPAKKWEKKLHWASAQFALLSDIAMGGLGGDLKRKEKLTGRFADVFSWLYLGTAVLRRFEFEGRKREDVPLLDWSMHYALARMQEAFDGILGNLTIPGATWLFKGPWAAWSRVNPLAANDPPDWLGHKLAKLVQVPGEQRDRLTAGMYVPDNAADEQVGRLDRAMRLCTEAETVVRKIKDAVRAKLLPKDRPEALLDQAVEAGIISNDDAQQVRDAEAARADAVAVDSFTLQEYLQTAAATNTSGSGSDADSSQLASSR